MKVIARKVATHLEAVSRRWVWLLTFRRLALGAALWSAAIVLWDAAVTRGWVNGPQTRILLGVVVVGTGALGMLVILIASVAAELDRRRLASALEEVHPPLLDRLNTVVHLEKRLRTNRYLDAYFPRIERQAAESLRKRGRAAQPFPAGPTLVCVNIGLACVFGGVWFFAQHPPWRYLRAAAPRLVAEAADDKAGFELAPTKSEEMAGANQIWGEVRITEPGQDLKLTKVDVVQLRIEAASRQTLQKVDWTYSINGGEPQPQKLPAPGEPNYAVYTPTLYLDELSLSDWDVVSYSASASSDKGSYGSDIYFIEIRPFREDIQKLPGGGENGKAGQNLNELGALIDRQAEILRQTHRHIATTYESDDSRAQDRGKLSAAEAELRDSAEHLYGKIAAQMENHPVGEILDHLALAQEAMRRAIAALNDDAAPDGQRHESTAFTELVATRKKFQKFITDHPDAFNGQPGQPGEPPPPIADTMKGMSNFTEYRNRQKAALNAVDRLLDEQRKLSDEVQPSSSSKMKSFAPRQEQLNGSLAELEKTQPELFHGADEELAGAKAAMDKAAESLRDGTGSAESGERRAVDRVQDLQQALSARSAQRGVTDAYMLKQLLDQEIRQMDRMQQAGQSAKQGQPSSAQSGHGGPPAGQGSGQPSSGKQGDKAGTSGAPNERAEARGLAESARVTTHDLKDLVEHDADASALAPTAELRHSLADETQGKLDGDLTALAQAADAAARRSAAARAGEGMKAISRAFENSAPGTTRKGRGQNESGTPSQDALEQALQELNSMAAQREAGHSIPPGDASKQQAQALADLLQGLTGAQGNSAGTADGQSDDPGPVHEGAALLAQARKTLAKDGPPVDAMALRKLLDAIEKFRVEIADKREKKEMQSEVTHIDPTKISPAYRERVQRYYRKLSEN